MSDDRIKLTSADLHSASVEGYLQEQDARRRTLEADPQPLVVRIIYSSYFYLSLAAGLGGLAAWAILEPFINEGALRDELRGGRGAETALTVAALFLAFPTVAAMVGLFLGAAEGIMSRNLPRAALCSAVGLGIGLVGGLVMLCPTAMVFGLMQNLAVALGPPPEGGVMPVGLGLMMLIMGRGAAWAIAASASGLGQGIALREKKVFWNGLVGAVLGGLLGGLLFDPIYLLLGQPETGAVSRGVGFSVIGIMVGLFVGLVEQWTKTAWLLMKAGPLAGKQFVLYRNPTVIGSSPKAEIYIFKDPAVEPRHALIHDRGGRFEIEDCGTPDGTYVNGVPVTRQLLQAGDQIVIGKTLLEFALRESR